MSHACDDNDAAISGWHEGWREAAIEYHKARGKNVSIVSYTPEELARLRKLMADDVSLERAWHELNATAQHDRAAASTVEAVMYELRTYGAAQLTKANCQRRLGMLSPEQMREVITRLIKLRPQYSAISDELLRQLEDRLP